MKQAKNTISSPVIVWLGLLALTVISLAAGEQFGHARWMPLLVAAIIWIKSAMVARYFIQSHLAHPLIAWIVRIFIGFAPAALVITVLFRK
jgi:hypothetical protein